MRAKLYNTMKDSGYTYKDIADKINCSVGVLTKFFTDGKSFKEGKTIKLDVVLNLVRLLCPEQEKDFMIAYCLESDKPNHLKCALEYAAIHQELDLFMELLNKCKNHSNKEVKEYYIIYTPLHERLMGTKNSIDIFKEISMKNFSYPELIVLKIIIEMNHHYQNHNFSYVDQLSEIVLAHISELKDGYLKDSYLVRCNQMIAFTYLHVKSNPVKAREVCEQSIGFALSERVNGFFYNIMATSYFGESLDKMNFYAQQSIDAYSRTDYVVDGLRKRYFKLNMISDNIMSMKFERDYKDPIDMYIEGVVQQDMHKLLQCLIELNKEGSMFFTSMVIKELNKMGCNQALIDSIQSINK